MKKRGRPRKEAPEVQIKEEPTSSSNSDSVICAVCKQTITKTNWSNHKLKEHNNLTWREGLDPPIDLEDDALVFKILSKIYKARKPLTCELCKEKKKSVVGFLSHKSQCQKSVEELEDVKVACKECGRKVLPVSLETHMRIHTRPPPSIFAERSISEVVGGPRKAAKHALRLINSTRESGGAKYYEENCKFDEEFIEILFRKQEKIECIFEASHTIDGTLVEHLKGCQKKPEQFFLCKLCLIWTKTESEVLEHLKTSHQRRESTDTDYFQEDDVDMEEIVERPKKRSSSKTVHLKTKPLYLVYPIKELNTLVYNQTYSWMHNFYHSNYCHQNLFNDLRNSNKWKLLDSNILEEFLPKNLESCRFIVNQSEVGFDGNQSDITKIGLFDCLSSYKGEATIYCGGPITSLAWLPVQDEEKPQILAVSTLNDFEKDYFAYQTHKELNVIQFYKFSPSNYGQEVKDLDASFLFGLALDTGPVWHLEWCPSGCQDESRLGLLAVATSDSYVCIYSIENLEGGLIHFGDPVVKLQLTKDIPEPFYATRISWSKAEGHQTIAVGYSNGLVAIFDLLSTGTLLSHVNRIITARYCFQAHLSCVIALTLSHLSGGARWLFTAGVDKNSHFWDLSNCTKVSSYRKNGVADAVWPIQWPTFMMAEDESFFFDNSSAYVGSRSIRDLLTSDHMWKYFTVSASGLRTISFSDWLNFMLQAGNGGELMGSFMHRLYFNMDVRNIRSNTTKCLLSMTEKLCDSKLILNSFDEARAHCVVMFKDYCSEKLQKIPTSKFDNLKSIKLQSYDVKEYPFCSINKVAVNPNPQVCHMYAVGYQAGFVRVRGLDFLRHSFVPIIRLDPTTTEKL